MAANGQNVDFCSGLEHKNILVNLLNNFRDLSIIPGSLIEKSEEIRNFSTDLLEFALKDYKPQLLDTGSMAEGVLAVFREPVGVVELAPFFEPVQDLMVVIPINTFYSETSNLELSEIPENPCFVRLAILEGNLTSSLIEIFDETAEERLLSPYQFLHLVKGNVQQSMLKDEWASKIYHWIWEDSKNKKVHYRKTEVEVSDHGPALQMTVKHTMMVPELVTSLNMDQEMDSSLIYSDTEERALRATDIDIVPALHLPLWPEKAAEWVSRKRLWPPMDLVQKIVSGGVMVVCKAPKHGNIMTDWRLSFSSGEIEIFTRKDLPCRNFAHRIFKYIVKHILHRPKVINSYHLKSITFWACERLPPEYWSWDNLAHCVLGLLDDLIGCIAAKSCPHYFIREVNLFSSIQPEFLSTFADKLVAVRRSPIIERPLVSEATKAELLQMFYTGNIDLRPGSEDKVVLAQTLLRHKFDAHVHEDDAIQLPDPDEDWEQFFKKMAGANGL